ncbi:hypothetical protein SKAU_G00391100 [Synaphobranchus kaupii]|uniref:Uncharacterized protein n=1 Tax=Synaphobranchus kaupii TaxID=118154 RepID=A0A9Q1EBF8_SYNKA|nr:hypothetical protein SKAU_G00391100 [Synaphobranchus kaupii]
MKNMFRLNSGKGNERREELHGPLPPSHWKHICSAFSETTAKPNYLPKPTVHKAEGIKPRDGAVSWLSRGELAHLVVRGRGAGCRAERHPPPSGALRRAQRQN